MNARVALQPYSVPRQHAYPSSQNLLNLDCSADLKSYRRDLGPGVQAKCFEKTSDTIRAQLDDHRAFLLRHRKSGQASRFPSPVPRLEVLQSYTVPSNNAVPPQLTVPNNNYHTASQPRPLQILSQPHAPLQTSPARPESPVPGNIGTYPIGLRQALERCNRYGDRHEAGRVHEVIVRITRERMPTTQDVVGVYESLQDANMKAANIFLFDGHYESGLYQPTYEVGDMGHLRCAVETDGSTGGYTEIYVKRASARRAQGPRRR
ncbi:uncharacterized protein EKO05_0008048 [Ascochyta rabiei]|uniref:Uncharacterized protein n=1 Tax=Didymella rabiei TaxID=5454 RepID=A0A163B6C6_DIDRA|nr:uncharacterized protein EKO05_0008048 [Ascochyta rabiei]KZM21597.1 hypothetical protein ST47_g7207 [Ascochyta rabiei]UPX17708.1 hypothetical protein EKO05_0008048 [Ascochyta rabiei]